MADGFYTRVSEIAKEFSQLENLKVEKKILQDNYNNLVKSYSQLSEKNNEKMDLLSDIWDGNTGLKTLVEVRKLLNKYMNS